ncbi:MAG TPA: hypothetical protein VJR92_07400 [Gemmatimonadaceae bacterium]|nr:hypothetical protein [Gemmatimonadaceae bacterium]
MTSRKPISANCAVRCVVLASTSACIATADATLPAAVQQDSAGIAIVSNDLARLTTICTVSAAPTVAIGSADGGEEYELHRVFGATQLRDGSIALVNQGTQQVRFYDRAGKFIKSSGRAGRGPGEFSDAFLMWNRPGDTIYVGNYVPWELHVFAPDGRFVRTVKPTPQYFNNPGGTFVLNDGRIVIADDVRAGTRRSPEFTVRHTKVLLHNADGTRADSIGAFEDGRWGVVDPALDNNLWSYPFFESFARMAGGGDRFIVGHSSKAELRVYTIGRTARVTQIIRFTTGDRRITAAHVAAEKKRIMDQYKGRPADQVARLTGSSVSDKRPIADAFPAFAGIELGRDGRLWMREYTKPGETAVAPWVAFSPAGRAVCRASFPRGAELLELGADYLLVMQTDSLGVEQVARYTLR